MRFGEVVQALMLVVVTPYGAVSGEEPYSCGTPKCGISLNFTGHRNG